MENKRHLIIIPIIHTHADYGERLGRRIPFDEEIEGRILSVQKIQNY